MEPQGNEVILLVSREKTTDRLHAHPEKLCFRNERKRKKKKNEQTRDIFGQIKSEGLTINRFSPKQILKDVCIVRKK